MKLKYEVWREPPTRVTITRIRDKFEADGTVQNVLKDKVYAMRPATIADLRAATECECTQIPRELFRVVCNSIASCCQQCLDQNGRQFENRLWKNNKIMFVNSITLWKLNEF